MCKLPLSPSPRGLEAPLGPVPADVALLDECGLQDRGPRHQGARRVRRGQAGQQPRGECLSLERISSIGLSYNNPALLYRAIIERKASENPILVQLSDDGSGPDFIQNDGIYSRNIKSEYANISHLHIYKMCVCE